MLVQNKLSNRLGLAKVENDFVVSILYEDGFTAYCSKKKFASNFTQVKDSDKKVIVYIVNKAYFTNESDANWFAKFIEESGHFAKRKFMYDTPSNIMKRIKNV